MKTINQIKKTENTQIGHFEDWLNHMQGVFGTAMFAKEKRREVKYTPVEYEYDYSDNEWHCLHASTHTGDISHAYDPAESFETDVCDECDRFFDPIDEEWHE